MADLQDMQRSFAQSVLGQSPTEGLVQAIEGGRLTPEARLRIHQNNYRESLGDALLGLFPLCQAFVGDLFLKQMLHHFVREHPPMTAALYCYGAGVPDFMRGQEACASVPYLADVAQLEWLTHELAITAEQPVFDDLATAQAAWSQTEGLQLHTNARLIASDFPLYDLWQAATGQMTPEDLDMEGGGQAILLVLNEGQVFYQMLESEIASLLGAIDRGDRIEALSDGQLEELIDRGAITVKQTE